MSKLGPFRCRLLQDQLGCIYLALNLTLAVSIHSGTSFNSGICTFTVTCQTKVLIYMLMLQLNLE